MTRSSPGWNSRRRASAPDARPLDRDAVADLQQISARIETDRSLALANRICRTIYTAVQDLRRHPAKGLAGRLLETRELVITGTPYFVVHRPAAEAIEILRVLHGARQWPPAS